MVITFNPLVVAGPLLLRVSDLLAAIAALWILGYLLRSGPLPRSWWMFFAINLALAGWWATVDLTGGHTPRLPLRWLEATFIGAATALLWREQRLQNGIIFGILFGCTLLVLLMLAQATISINRLGPVLLHDPDVQSLYYVSGQVRQAGIYGHPNSAAAVVSLAVPTAFAALQSWRAPLLSLSLASLAAALTATRASFLVALLTAGSEMGRKTPRVALALLAVGILTVSILGPPGGWGRWLDSPGIEENAGGRIATMEYAVRILGDYPFGAGSAYGESIGLPADFPIHNAFLEFAMYFGWIGIIWLVVLLLWTIFSAPRGSFESLLAIHLVLLFLFENHLSNITFMALVQFLAFRVLKGRLDKSVGIRTSVVQ